MSSDYQSSNPYASSAYTPSSFAGQSFGSPTQAPRESAPGKLMLPAMAMIAAAVLGLLFSAFSFVMSFGEAQVQFGAPPMVQEMQRGTVGPTATAIQGSFVIVNLFIIVCGVQMMKMQNWGLGVAGSVLSILNLGSCCCVIGAPIGLWSLAVLMSPEIISMYTTANQPEQAG